MGIFARIRVIIKKEKKFARDIKKLVPWRGVAEFVDIPDYLVCS